MLAWRPRFGRSAKFSFPQSHAEEQARDFAASVASFKPPTVKTSICARRCAISIIAIFQMINGKRIAVVMPAYNAEKTLEVTVGELPSLVDIRILVDDQSSDQTVDLARRLGLLVFLHDRNYGYGRNQQTCYREALAAGADVVIMLHPDYQYTPLLITAMASMVAYGVYDVVLGSRIIGGLALRGGMPIYKYISNRALTAAENLVLRVKLSEYHTGYRAFGREVLTTLPLLENSDDFVFDNQMLAQCVHFGFRIGEVSCPTKYFKEASSINFGRSVRYGFGVLGTTLQFALQRAGIIHLPRFSDKGRKLETEYPAYYANRTDVARPASAR
jgi:glycosyltransferase involved in cell wall biosynthesis